MQINVLIHSNYHFFLFQGTTFQMILSLADSASFHAGLSIPDDDAFKASPIDKQNLWFRSSTKDALNTFNIWSTAKLML